MSLTKKQKEVYDFIDRFVQEHQHSPSFEEIGKGLKLNSLATVHKHISNLERKGLLKRDYNRSRSIELLDALLGLAFSALYRVPGYQLGHVSDLAFGFFCGFGLTHYYLDSRLWRVRHDPSLRQVLQLA